MEEGQGKHPVQLSIGYQAHYSRGLGCLGAVFFYGRYIALIPVLVWLYILLLVAFLVAWAMQIVVVFTGEYPQWAHRFLTGVLRLTSRMYAWLFGLTDTYPGFRLEP
ncbi:MAG: DUF4389 domain-containing protein [Candidatus Dormibacteria bacterium]